jgi:hypothetical protein
MDRCRVLRVYWHLIRGMGEVRQSTMQKFITLDDKSNESLCWSKNPKEESFTMKLGYKFWHEEIFEGPKKWWWGFLWKMKAPTRCKFSWF